MRPDAGILTQLQSPVRSDIFLLSVFEIYGVLQVGIYEHQAEEEGDRRGIDLSKDVNCGIILFRPCLATDFSKTARHSRKDHCDARSSQG